MLKRLMFISLLFLWCAPSSSQTLRLFTSEMKKAVPKNQFVVLNFLERYFNNLSSKDISIQTKMADDKVYFRKGKPIDLLQVCDSMPFSITLYDRYYEVKWTKNNKPFIVIVFPARYDLLLGVQKDEALRRFKDEILVAPDRKNNTIVPSDLKCMCDSLYQTSPDTFEIASLTDALYYKKIYDSYQPVFDDSHLEYSAANLFHGLISGVDYRMYIEQSVYGMNTINYSLMLSQWLNYCAEWGLKIYFAIEEVRKDGLLVFIIAHNQELGYNHLLSVVIPDKFVKSKDAVLKVRMTPYIPIHNVKNLYKKYSSTHKKIKWK